MNRGDFRHREKKNRRLWCMTIYCLSFAGFCAQLAAFCVKSEKRVLRQDWDFDLESKNTFVFTLSEPVKDVFSLISS